MYFLFLLVKQLPLYNLMGNGIEKERQRCSCVCKRYSISCHFWVPWQLCWRWGSLVLPLWKTEIQQLASISGSCQRLSNNICNSLSTKHNKTSTHWIKTNGSTLQHQWAMKNWKLCMNGFYPCSDTRNHALEKKIYIILCTNSLCVGRNPKY